MSLLGEHLGLLPLGNRCNLDNNSLGHVVKGEWLTWAKSLVGELFPGQLLKAFFKAANLLQLWLFNPFKGLNYWLPKIPIMV